MSKIIYHSFYCINCGNKVLDLPRNRGHLHGKFHRKKLYCPYCKAEINCVECHSDEDIYDFKLDFEKGLFKDEAEDSLLHTRANGQW